jgi:hypothetical protein
MTRTLDEIKKGLECCSSTANCADGCPYHVIVEGSFGCDEMGCEDGLLPDALALIQQLQAENAQQARCIENMTDKLNAMNDEVAKLQAERDAAVADLRRAMHCPSCANWRKPEKAAVCFACQYGRTRRFEWRGVPKEE